MCIIYNFYVIVSMLCILLYAEKAQKKYYRRDDVVGVELSSFRVPALDVILIVIPVIWIVAKYGLSAFSGYTTLNRRAVDSESVWSINQLITLSIYLYITRFFSKERKFKENVLLFIWMFVLAWINGKRYIIVTMMEAILFMYQQFVVSNKKARKLNLRVIIPAGIVAILAFSIFYRTTIKVTAASEYIYGSLRVDFGRDDVTKYVIKNVLLEGKKILEYPGQSFLNLFFFL